MSNEKSESEEEIRNEKEGKSMGQITYAQEEVGM